VHRWVAEKYILKRRLRKNEVVHHKDGNPTNNDVENLQVMKSEDHNILHEKRSRGWGKRHGVESHLEDSGCLVSLISFVFFALVVIVVSRMAMNWYVVC